MSKNHNVDVGLSRDEKELVVASAKSIDMKQTAFCRHCILTICYQMKNPQLRMRLDFKSRGFVFEEFSKSTSGGATEVVKESDT